MGAVQPPQHLWYLKGFRFFRHLPKAKLRRLQARLKPLRFQAGGVIYSPGDPATSVLLVRKGAVEIARLGPRGRKVGLNVLGPGEVFGHLGVFAGGERPHQATALEASQLWRLRAGEFLRLCRDHPDFTIAVARSLTDKAILCNARIEDLLFKSVPIRLAEALADLAARFGSPLNGAWDLNLPITQQNLADLVGASRQHVNGAMRYLAQEGLIRLPGSGDRRYKILDLARLRQWARAGTADQR